MTPNHGIDQVSAEATPGSAGPVATNSRSSRTIRRRLIQGAGLGTFYLIVVIYFSVVSPVFFTFSNGVNILSGAAVIGVVALGQTLAIVSGGFDLSVGGTVPLGAVLYTTLVNTGMSIPLALALAVFSGSLVGAVNGLIINGLKINPLITTLGTFSIAVGLAYTIANGLTTPMTNFEAGFLSDNVGRVPIYVLVFIGLAVVCHLVLRYSTFGRRIYAIGGNPEASRLAGIRVGLVSSAIYVISGSLAAFGGVIVASQLLAGSPAVGSDAALQSVAAVILGGAALTGGVGGVPGTIVGVLLLGTIANGMALLAVPPFYQQIATGSVLLIAVIFSQLRIRALEK